MKVNNKYLIKKENDFKVKLQNIPQLPGCYQYFDKFDNIIYVGKAKNLFKRVNSYFERFQSVKTDELVKNIVRFDFIVTNTEKESLLLEINLIQKYKPKYNILLKDGRNYPFIRISNDTHCKIDYVLNRRDDDVDGKYYGPFPDAKTARGLVDIINKTFKFRKCKNIPKRKCIYYDMGQCYGPCINLLAKNIYDEDLKMISDFFNSKPKKLILFLKEKMESYADKFDFESAMEIRDNLLFINEFIEKQIVNIDDKSSFDIISIRNENDIFGMYTLSVRGGMILAHDFISDNEKEIEEIIINRYTGSKVKFYLDNLQFIKIFDGIFENMKVANQGIYLDLMKLANKNLKIQLDKEILEYTKQNQIKLFFNEALNIVDYTNIFMLDISHLGGENNVGGLVCFTQNVKNKKLYRHYKVSKEVNDDAGSITEIVQRICDNQILISNIDVFIVDGGIVQKNVVERVFKLNNVTVPVLALEKNSKHTTHEILYEDHVFELNDPTLLRYFARIQDEVHRFANTFMNFQNTKSKTTSIFSSIKGVGPKRQSILEANFNSLDSLISASIDDLQRLGFSTKVAIDILEAAAELI